MTFDEPAMNIGEDIMTLADFGACMRSGILIPDDGSGYFGTATHYSYEGSVWSATKIPEGATHVHWYNK